MKTTNPRRIALINALLVTGIVLVVFVSMAYIIKPSTFILLLVILATLFITAFLAFRYTLEKFIYDKIKLIYKTIHNFKVQNREKREQTHTKPDMIEKARQEVIAWSEERMQEIENLRKLAAYRREYIGNITHELKTPIFSIQGYVLTLLDGGLEDPTINKEFLLRTEKSVNRLIAIIDDLDTITQLETGEMKLDYEKFDLVDLTREVIEILEVKAKKRKNKIGFGGTYDKPVYVSADREKIRHVLSNLIDNALKYGKEKGGTTRISFFDMDEYILTEITDDGMGIERENMSRLFERFYRTEQGRMREHHGTGLGLSIVKHILESHDQTINVRSTVGVGSTFAFTLKKT